MIHIEEKLTSKVPGITSVFIDFPYNKEIVADIKTLPCFNYSKRSHKWEVPIKYLHNVLDLLCVYDDIELDLCDITFEEDKKYKLSKYKTNPFDYQIDGIQYMLNHSKCLLLDPPGLGKTMQLTYLAEELKKREHIKHCLIVCGLNTLKTNWEKEIQKHSKLDCMILGKRINTKGNIVFEGTTYCLNQLKKPIKEFFVIVNIEKLRSKEIVKELQDGKNKFDMIVVDEIHKVKEQQAQQSQGLLKLSAPYMIGATGTLLVNNPMDCFVPLSWIGAERATKTNFQAYYTVYGGDFGKEFLGYRNLDTLKKQLQLYSLRRPKSLLNLPDKTIIEEYVDMSDTQQKFYENIKNGVVEEADKIELKPNAVLAMVGRLRQVTACPSILTTNNIPSAKIDRACDLVEQIVENGDKVVIFSTFKDTVSVLQTRLQRYNPLIGTGDLSDDEVSSNVDKFQNDNEHKVFIGTWQKCGTGLTLTAASYMIHIDTAFTQAAFEQTCDRIYRIGTTKPVTIYNLITTGTVDERVRDIVTDKGALSDYIIDDKITQSGYDSLVKYIQELKQK